MTFALGLLCLTAFSVGCGDRAPRDDERFALLALGDTGLAPGSHGGQRAVARALSFEDRLRPVDGLALMGDNFYPRGLERHELTERIRHNLVSPYCRFLVLGPRAPELGSTCRPERPRGPVWAVLGNHDHEAPESPELQRRVVPEFVANWSMPTEDVAVRRVAEGVDFILVDSKQLLAQGPRTLALAIGRSRGPWRILISHVPLIDGYGERDGIGEAVAGIAGAIASAGVPVQLTLAGHEHNLQAFELSDRAGLAVVAGGGSSARSLHEEPPTRVHARETRGFARVAILAGEPERLRVELIAVPRVPWPGFGPIVRDATYTVSLAGEVSVPASKVNP